MPLIRYTAAHFSPAQYPLLQGTNVLNASWPELVWAAVTAGRQSWADVMQHGHFSVQELFYRAFLLHANYCEGPGGVILRSPAYDTLDPSEKGAVSFFFGLTIGKLFAARRLGVPWMMHLGVYRRALVPLSFTTNLRPDFVGLDQGHRWLSMEAKGRTSLLPSHVFAYAKRQSESLTRVRGAAVSGNVACGAFFRNSQLRVRIEDPPTDPNEPRSLTLNASADDVIRDYYKTPLSFLDAVRRKKLVRTRSRAFRVGAVPLLGVQIGVDSRVVELVRGKQREVYDELIRVVPPIPQPLARRSSFAPNPTDGGVKGTGVLSDRFYLGPDGIAVWLEKNWNPKLMQHEPGKRR